VYICVYIEKEGVKERRDNNMRITIWVEVF